MRFLAHHCLQDLSFDMYLPVQLQVGNCTTGGSLEKAQNRMAAPFIVAIHRGRSEDK